MLVCATFYNFAHEIAGAARIRHSLRPLSSRGRENYLQSSGTMGRENANSHPVVIVREGGRTRCYGEKRRRGRSSGAVITQGSLPCRNRLTPASPSPPSSRIAHW